MLKGKSAAALLALACVAGTHGVPKIGTEDKGFVPSKNYAQMKDQLAMESGAPNQSLTPSASDKAGRFGFPTYTTDGQNYPQNVNNVVPGLYGPVKLDIGGLVLGTIVGLGAFFILPKILHVISTPYGSYKRSEDEPSGNGVVVADVYNRLKDSLAAANIDATSCLQRAVCMSFKQPSSQDSIINSLTKNDMVKTLLAGTDWERAMEVGSTGHSCGLAFPKCPFTLESIIKPLVTYLSAE